MSSVENNKNNNKGSNTNTNSPQSQNVNNKLNTNEQTPKEKKDEQTNDDTQTKNKNNTNNNYNNNDNNNNNDDKDDHSPDSPLLTPIPKEPEHKRFVVTGGLDDTTSPLNTDKEAATDALFDNSDGNTSSFSDLSQLSPILFDKTPQKKQNDKNEKKRSRSEFEDEHNESSIMGTSRQHALQHNDSHEPVSKRQRIEKNTDNNNDDDNSRDNNNNNSYTNNEFSELFIPGHFDSSDESTLNSSREDDSLSKALKTPISKKKRNQKTKQQKAAQFHQQSVKKKRSRARNAHPSPTSNRHSTRSPEEIHLQSTSFQGMDEDEEPIDDDDFVPSSKRLQKELNALSRKERRQREEAKNPDQLSFNRYNTSPDQVVSSDVFVTPRRPKRRFERRKQTDKMMTPETPTSPRHHGKDNNKSPKEISPNKMTAEEEKKWKEKQKEEENRLKNMFDQIDDVDLEEEEVLEV